MDMLFQLTYNPFQLTYGFFNESMEKAEDFKILTKEDTRKHVQVPKDIEIL